MSPLVTTKKTESRDDKLDDDTAVRVVTVDVGAAYLNDNISQVPARKGSVQSKNSTG